MKISLRLKLTAFSTLLILAVVSGVGLSVYWSERLYLIKRFAQTQEDTLNFLVQMKRESVASQNAQMLNSYLSLLRRNRALSYAMIQDKDGRVTAHTNTALINTIASDDVTANAVKATSLLQQTLGASGDIVDLALPVLQGTRYLGVARVGFSQQTMTQLVDQLLQSARNRIVLAALISLAGGILLAVALSFLFDRPIRHLRDGAHRIGEGHLDHQIKITTSDELGDLANEFNVMANKLKEVAKLKQDFVSNVTHELRSPLTSLRGYVELLLKGSAGRINEEQRDYLIVIKNNAVRLARFIDNLLDVAKIEAHKIEIHPETIKLQDVALETVVLFRPMAEEKKIEFVVSLPPQLPPLHADADKLLEILTNLVSNAIKFTPPEGRVTLAGEEENEFIHIRVQDTGSGIPPENLDTVFNKFEQVKPTRGLARKTKGTGLGLTIVKGFVEAHGGRVWVESQVDQGTTMHVLLPKSPLPPL